VDAGVFELGATAATASISGDSAAGSGLLHAARHVSHANCVTMTVSRVTR
jgi:hypothetical protein